MGHSVWVGIVLFGITAAYGAEETGILRVQVSHEGKPLAGARVSAGGSNAATDSSGEAMLVLPAGRVRVEIAHEGLEGESAEVTVRSQACVSKWCRRPSARPTSGFRA